MKNQQREKTSNEISGWQVLLLFLTNMLLGIGAFWFAWFRSTSILNRLESNWYDWTQPVFATSMGILCLAAAVLFILRKPAGWAMFKTGLSMIPLILFTNLMILLFRVVQSIFQGNGVSFLSRLYASPLNKAILALVIILIVRAVIEEVKKKEKVT